MQQAPDLDDDFEFILSRKVSVNTEFDPSFSRNNSFQDRFSESLTRQLTRKAISRAFAKPEWIDSNLEVHKMY